MPARPNVGTPERWLSLLFGGVAMAAGVRRRRLFGGLLAALGGYLLWRGASGRCLLYQRLRVTTARANDGGLWGRKMIHVRSQLQVPQPRNMVYRHWRNLEQLPAAMRHIRSVRVHGNRSHWVARLPLGLQAQWVSQIIQDSPNERLVWQSLPGSRVDSRGEIRFRPTSRGGTEIDVDMYYHLPSGPLPRFLAGLLGGMSERMIHRDLERFGSLLDQPSAVVPELIDDDQGLGREPRTPMHG
jgi:uncharacterized membrane protein